MLHDPPVPADGTCAQCGGERRKWQGKKSYANAEQYASEPFCSSECCREWHGTVIPPLVGTTTPRAERVSQYGTEQKRRWRAQRAKAAA